MNGLLRERGRVPKHGAPALAEGRFQPEKALMIAVLQESQKCALSTSPRACWQTERAAAIRWFWDDDVVWPYSFRNICETLLLDATAVRDVLRRGLAAQHIRAPGRPVVQRRVA